MRFDFAADTVDATLTIRREFAASRQLVWDCHTRSELLDRWFAPKPLTTRTAHMEFREGGYWLFAMVEPGGAEHWSRMDYQTIVPIDGYTLLDGFCDSSGALTPDMPRSSWDVAFSDAGEHTLVRTIVSYDSPADLEKVIAMGIKEGMTSTLDRLDELLVALTSQRLQA